MQIDEKPRWHGFLFFINYRRKLISAQKFNVSLPCVTLSQGIHLSSHYRDSVFVLNIEFYE